MTATALQHPATTTRHDGWEITLEREVALSVPVPGMEGFDSVLISVKLTQDGKVDVACFPGVDMSEAWFDDETPEAREALLVERYTEQFTRLFRGEAFALPEHGTGFEVLAEQWRVETRIDLDVKGAAKAEDVRRGPFTPVIAKVFTSTGEFDLAARPEARTTFTLDGRRWPVRAHRSLHASTGTTAAPGWLGSAVEASQHRHGELVDQLISLHRP